MPIKKSELYSSLWKSCDELRGGMDASQYKDYGVSQTLTGRVRELAERYVTPLPKLTTEVETFAARVEVHLKKMGFAP